MNDGAALATPPRRTHTRLHLRLRVRPLLLRFLANALALAFTAIVVPNIYFSGDHRILSWLLISAVFGLLNAFLKPLIQVVMLPLIFVSYGLVVVLINSILLLALSWIFPQRFHVHTLIWALVGGLVCGLLEGRSLAESARLGQCAAAIKLSSVQSVASGLSRDSLFRLAGIP